MRNLLKILSEPLLALTIAIGGTACFSSECMAQTAMHERIEALDEMDFIEMINSVDVGKTSELIQKFQTKEGKTRLLNGKYNPKGSVLSKPTEIRRCC